MTAYRSVAEALSVTSAVEASWSEAENVFIPLMQKNGPMSSAKLAQIQSKLRGYNRANVVRIGDDVLTGIIRHALGTSRANLTFARAVLSGPNASSHLDTVFSLVDSAKQCIRQLQTMANAVETVQEWTGLHPTRNSASLVRLDGLGFAPPLWLAAAVLVAGIVIFVVGVSVLIDAMQRSQNAEIALRSAHETCDLAERQGHPCTPEQFQRHYEEALRAQNEISPPLLQRNPGSEDPASKLADLVFWGGLLVVAAGVGYAVWTTLPAAQAFRRRSLRPDF